MDKSALHIGEESEEVSDELRENLLYDYVITVLDDDARKSLVKKLDADSKFRSEMIEALIDMTSLIGLAWGGDDHDFLPFRRAFIEKIGSNQSEIREMQLFYLRMRNEFPVKNRHPDYEDRLGSVMSELEDDLLNTLPPGKNSPDKHGGF